MRASSDTYRLMGIVSFVLSILLLLLIFNWFFKLTSFQTLQGFPLMIAPLAGPVGLAMGILSQENSPNFCAFWSIPTNSILFVLPFIYWFLSTIFLGV